MGLTNKCIVSLQCDLLVLFEETKLCIEVICLVEGRLVGYLTFFNANIQFSLLLEKHLKDCDVGVYIVSYMRHLRV